MNGSPTFTTKMLLHHLLWSFADILVLGSHMIYSALRHWRPNRTERARSLETLLLACIASHTGSLTGYSAVQSLVAIKIVFIKASSNLYSFHCGQNEDDEHQSKTTQFAVHAFRAGHLRNHPFCSCHHIHQTSGPQNHQVRLQAKALGWGAVRNGNSPRHSPRQQ